MKNLCLVFLILILPLSAIAQVQPLWRFYIAFEEGSGQKDTIWCIYDDTLATSMGVDTIFGEGAVTLSPNIFNVYILNYNGDTTKTSALDTLGSHQLYIEATNYLHPIFISWDSTILHTYLPFLETDFLNRARIDNNYFFSVNNNSSFQQFDMTIDNHVLAPAYNWGAQDQFPMSILLASDPFLSYGEHHVLEKIKLYPNPANNFITIQNSELIESWELISLQSEIILNGNSIRNPIKNIDLSDLEPGIYIVKIFTVLKTTESFKLIKL